MESEVQLGDPKINTICLYKSMEHGKSGRTSFLGSFHSSPYLNRFFMFLSKFATSQYSEFADPQNLLHLTHRPEISQVEDVKMARIRRWGG